MLFQAVHPYAQHIAMRAIGPHLQHWDFAAHRENPFHERMDVEGITVEATVEGSKRESSVHVPAPRTRLEGFRDLATGEHPHGSSTPYYTLIRHALGKGEHLHVFSTGPPEQPVIHLIHNHVDHHALPTHPRGEVEVHRQGDGVLIRMHNTPHGR